MGLKRKNDYHWWDRIFISSLFYSKIYLEKGLQNQDVLAASRSYKNNCGSAQEIAIQIEASWKDTSGIFSEYILPER